jgi:DNA ligase 1
MREDQQAISKGLEGLVVKKQESRYEAGARNFNWVKLKRHSAGALDDTIDCVLLGYLVGRGKRAALGAGALLVGVYDPRQDLFVTVTKIGTGLSQAQNHFLSSILPRPEAMMRTNRTIH